jgi:hypothetical protein
VAMQLWMQLGSIQKASLCTSCWQFEWQKRPKTFLLIKRNAMKKDHLQKQRKKYPIKNNVIKNSHVTK